MKLSPGKGPGHDREGPCRRPFPEGTCVGTPGFRVQPFSARRQNLYGERQTAAKSSDGTDSGQYGVRHGLGQDCLSSGNRALPRVNSPPTARVDLRRGVRIGQLANRCESPAVARDRPVRGGGWAWWEREAATAAPAEGPANDDGGKPQRRVSVRPAGGGWW
jgi:hypothetical protein